MKKRLTGELLPTLDPFISLRFNELCYVPLFEYETPKQIVVKKKKVELKLPKLVKP